MTRNVNCFLTSIFNIFKLKTTNRQSTLTSVAMDDKYRPPCDIELRSCQFTFIDIINNPRPIPSEHVEGCSDNGWFFWQ